MTDPLPPVPPDVTARAVDLLPGRLRRRLDEAVARARSWAVTAAGATVVIRADEDTVVTLRLPVRADEDVTCSCLLAPACTHRAAVLSLAPFGATAPESEPASASGAASTVESRAIGDQQLAAVDAVWRAGCDLLASGIAGAGAVHQAVLLRAAHEARAVGLPRLSSAALRVVARLRAARSEQADFRLAQLVGDMRELLLVAYGLRTGHGDAGPLRGSARRDYRPVGNLRLYGLLCETIATASGYAGAVTYLVDETGRLWQLGGVTPGGTALAAGRPDALVTIGEARLTYRELSHGGLHVVNATASTDGRLGSGKTTTAVAAPGAGWYDDPLSTLWRPLADQVAAYRAVLAGPRPDRPCGYDLLFLDGTVAGFTESGLGLHVDGSVVSISAPTDTPDLPYVDNLRILGAAVGAPLRVVGRYAGPAIVSGLAVAAGWLDAGHVNLGVERLHRTDLPEPVPVSAGIGPTAPAAPEISAPLHLLTRRLERCVEGGRPAAPGNPSDIGRLRAAQLHTAAQLAHRLDLEAARVRRDHFGRVEIAGNEQLALAWLAGAVFAEAAAERD